MIRKDDEESVDVGSVECSDGFSGPEVKHRSSVEPLCRSPVLVAHALVVVAGTCFPTLRHEERPKVHDRLPGPVVLPKSPNARAIPGLVS